MIPCVFPNRVHFKIRDYKSCVEYFGHSNCITNLINEITKQKNVSKLEKEDKINACNVNKNFIKFVTNNIPPSFVDSNLHQETLGCIQKTLATML